MSLRTIPIHPSLHRPVTFLGGDREIGQIALVIAIAAAAVGQSILIAASSLVFWLIIIYITRKLGKYDPYMKNVYLSNLRFRQQYYPAHSHILAPRTNVYYSTVINKTGMKYKKK